MFKLGPVARFDIYKSWSRPVEAGQNVAFLFKLRSKVSWYGRVWCLFIQHQRTSYIAQITQDAEREMHEV